MNNIPLILQEQQEKSTEEARKEHQRIKEVRERLTVLKDEFNCNQINEESSHGKQEYAEFGKVGNDLNSFEEELASTTKRYTSWKFYEKKLRNNLMLSLIRL